jgi:hypothetical protein
MSKHQHAVQVDHRSEPPDVAPAARALMKQIACGRAEVDKGSDYQL